MLSPAIVASLFFIEAILIIIITYPFLTLRSSFAKFMFFIYHLHRFDVEFVQLKCFFSFSCEEFIAAISFELLESTGRLKSEILLIYSAQFWNRMALVIAMKWYIFPTFIFPGSSLTYCPKPCAFSQTTIPKWPEIYLHHQKLWDWSHRFYRRRCPESVPFCYTLRDSPDQSKWCFFYEQYN